MNYINIAELWRLANVSAGREITQREINEKSGVTQATISKMKNGGKCNEDKLAAVANALHDAGRLKRPKRIIISWLE